MCLIWLFILIDTYVFLGYMVSFGFKNGYQNDVFIRN